ncbi:MAG: hypothetical protein A2138_01835 [Deltaproteobacteria bacterium RBG_16_71_12]|nr:MAG: hypothetical protein A2138_01835 [Deltaproteobacteria bacterium RBG_16_71_12]
MARRSKREVKPKADDPDSAPLPQRAIREIRRRVRDLDDPIRYVIVSAFTPRFILYFDVTSDSFVMNDLSGGTLFKRRAHAAAIAAVMRDGLQIVKVKVGRRGSLKALSPIKPRLPRRRPSG